MILLAERMVHWTRTWHATSPSMYNALQMLPSITSYRTQDIPSKDHAIIIKKYGSTSYVKKEIALAGRGED